MTISRIPLANGDANAVGYDTAAGEKNQWKLYAVQFEGVAGTAFKLQDIGTNLEGPDYDDFGNFMSTAPMLQVRNAENTGYTFYYYLNDGNLTEPGWTDQAGEPLANDVEIPAGTAFWFLDQYNATSSLIIPGQVREAQSASITISKGWSIVANRYPMSIAFEDMDFGTLTGPDYDDFGNFMSTAPMMQVRNAANTGYTFYYFLNDGKLTEPGWADQSGEPIDYSAKLIDVNRPMWFNLQAAPYDAAFELTFTK